MLLQGKRILVMGLLDTRSFAWAIGTRAAAEGAEVIYTVQNERFRDVLLRRSFKSEGLNIEDYKILPCDVTKDEEVQALFQSIEGPLDGLVHSVAYANPKTCLAETMFEAPRQDVLTAFEISAASLVFVAGAAREKFTRGGSIIALSFDSQNVYPNYNWMGVCKAALEACARYLARDLGSIGVRVNSLSAGPQKTMAATHIPGFSRIANEWPGRSPIGWDLDGDRDAVGDSAVYLLSDLSKRVTGELLHVDGGFHCTGVKIRED
ncbi:MAG: fabI [Armatimonadetes bacterium]|jgi:enoyl-[acyl-carrier protein] reductase I|nr:fabI [Armatimonadota bacterium]